jgi:hypothetical protein
VSKGIGVVKDDKVNVNDGRWEMIVGCVDIMECESEYAGIGSTDSDRLLVLNLTYTLMLQ